jgi:protein gp37
MRWRRGCDGPNVHRVVRHVLVASSVTGIPFFFKQRLNERGRKVSLPELDGREWAEMPGIVHV